MVRQALISLVLAVLAGGFISYRLVGNELTPFGLVLLGGYALLVLYRVIVLIFALRGKSDPSVAGYTLARLIGYLMWGAFALLVIAGVPAFVSETLKAGWVGIVLPIAVLIPVVTITVTMGWHRPAFLWIKKLRGKS
ncbi:MAG: hypothetical protein QUV02_04990 [Maricaulis sp.]|uniref:hypothetical protein n=1 Tax=Maricaulis sp. TaxID=1486257 RepID=UPI0026353D4A|nr:hypothetical protein [Maricaulis sp.]MDM7983783.1 hypothetical protein [Maricaulis sp.]